ncbi:tetratricopeptide repeat protein [Panacibacter ginsenosidivorans]|uniref:Tetratricopeptide repeat protein n=1 Tax=Panacibacter ginsenosidivorans TaxID=1813871 RepID=A0A5B8V6J8_9BACT|nr:tetratricopeptide repeat protein [Panacibacter ginsenosidivorans]QEC66371.1 tetratricopeptide repeat protein [Panacibacter ginsenosidivorans]
MVKQFSTCLICALVTINANSQASNTATNNYEKGVTLRKAQKYEEALIALKEAIEEKQNYTEALYEAGWICDELKKYEEAIKYLREATQLNPSAANLFELAYACENSGRKEEAKENYKTVLELAPKHADAARCLADIYYAEENYETALRYYKKYFAANMSPDAYCYYKAAVCSNYFKDYSNASVFLEKYEPKGQKAYAEKYTEMGYTYLMLGYNDDAINAYKNALDANAENGTALRGMADIYYNNLKDYDKALVYIKLALQKDEEHSRDYYYKAGWIYIGQEKYSEAIPFLQKAEDNDEKDVHCREQLGYAYYMLNKYEDAIAHFNKAIELDKESTVSYYYKGLSYVTLNKPEDAKAVYLQMKPINKTDADNLLKEIKQKEKALKNLASNKNSKKQGQP